MDLRSKTGESMAMFVDLDQQSQYNALDRAGLAFSSVIEHMSGKPHTLILSLSTSVPRNHGMN